MVLLLLALGFIRFSKRQEQLDAAPLKALTITKDHLAIYPVERSRIEKAGGVVSADGRLNGRIQVSRSFGDLHFKKVIDHFSSSFLLVALVWAAVTCFGLGSVASRRARHSDKYPIHCL